MSDAPFGRKYQFEHDRQHPRFHAKPLHDLLLQLKTNEINLRIANISMGGLGLMAEGQSVKVEKTFSATLSIAAQKFPVELESVFQNQETIGCRFVNPSIELQDCIGAYFETEVIASKLTRIETKPDGDNFANKVIFYHGQNNCELLINERRGVVTYFSVIILGNCFEVNPKEKLTMGAKLENKEIPIKPGVRLFSPLEIDLHLLKIAMRFVDSIETLTAEYRKNLIDILKDLALDAKLKEVSQVTVKRAHG